MIYNFKEYEPKFDTPMKKQQELAVARKIMDLLNKNTYDDLEEFITKNNKYQDFLKKNSMQTVMKHFGNTLKEEDYVKILENLRELTKSKKEFDQENITTTNIDEKQYNTYKGADKTYYIDNSRTDKPIEEQMKDLQPTEEQFQTTDAKKNSENMFKELERKKETLNLSYLHEINYDLLNNEEKEKYNIADNLQQNLDSGVVRVDIKKGVIVDELDNIMKIEKNNGEFAVIKDGDVVEKEQIKQKTIQKTLTPNNNSIYSN